MNAMTWLGATAAAAMCMATAPALAQAPNVNDAWFKVCSQQDKNEICSVQFNRRSSQGRQVVNVNLLRIKGAVNRELFQIVVPSGRAIQPGIKMRIDTGRENTIPYSLCLPDRCIAETKLTPPLVSALKNGGSVKLVSTNFRNEQNVFDVSLKGFTAANDGPPMKRDQFAQGQEQLKKQLEEKAAAARQKLLDAQKAAKEGG